MPQSRARRWLFLLALAVPAISVFVLTGCLLVSRYLPVWREHEIAQTLAQSRDPAFWWPENWREEYQARRSREGVIQTVGVHLHTTAVTLNDELSTLESVKLIPAPDDSPLTGRWR